MSNQYWPVFSVNDNFCYEECRIWAIKVTLLQYLVKRIAFWSLSIPLWPHIANIIQWLLFPDCTLCNTLNIRYPFYTRIFNARKIAARTSNSFKYQQNTLRKQTSKKKACWCTVEAWQYLTGILLQFCLLVPTVLDS